MKLFKKLLIITSILVLLYALLHLALSYPSITTTVVDAETGKPIEGAVVLAEWTITKGYGFTGTFSYTVVEVLTDKDGKAHIEGTWRSTHRPDVTVYKKGYVAWSDKVIFPDLKPREDFKWKDGYVFRLERFKPEYSYDEHQDFIGNAIHTNLDTKNKQLFLKMYREAEEESAFKERIRKRKEDKR